MRRNFLFLLMLNFLPALLFSQQNAEFKKVKIHFESQKSQILTAFKREFVTKNDPAEKAGMHREFVDFMKKMDSVQNSVYIATLVKVKNDEDLAKLNNLEVNTNEFHDGYTLTKAPEYPGGLNELRRQIADGFFAETVLPMQKQFKTLVSFVVEKDGSISTVEATGENHPFNIQAMIAVYLLPNKFSPALLAGRPLKYRYTLPLVLNFD